jgi:hypothetical protein
MTRCGEGHRRAAGRGTDALRGGAPTRCGEGHRRAAGRGTDALRGGAPTRCGEGHRRAAGRGTDTLRGGAPTRCGEGHRRPAGRGTTSLRGGARPAVGRAVENLLWCCPPSPLQASTAHPPPPCVEGNLESRRGSPPLLTCETLPYLKFLSPCLNTNPLLRTPHIWNRGKEPTTPPPPGRGVPFYQP